MIDILLNSIFIISLSIIIALLAGIYSLKKLNAPLKIMYYYAWVSTVFGGIISIMSLKGTNNIFLINTYSLIEFLLIGTAYFVAFNFRKKVFLILFCIAICSVFGIYTIQTIKDPNIYNNALKAAISIIMVVASVGYLVAQFHKGELEGDKKPLILLAVGTFMYFASSFFIVLIGSDSSLLTEVQVLWIYLIHSIFYLIFVIILTFAFLICRRQSGHSNLY
jgi:hypothetical protein